MSGTKYCIQPGNPLLPGVSFFKEEINFVFAVPQDAEAELLLFYAEEEDPCQCIPLTGALRFGNLAAVAVGIPDTARHSYLYRVNGREMTDPYAVCLQDFRQHGRIVRRCVLQRPVCASVPPPQIPFEDCVFYKLHVRGFTMQKSGVRSKGTFAGLRESVLYFKELGVNALLLMPVYEFAETPAALSGAADVCAEEGNGREERKNYWGYTGGAYFCPKLSYCAKESPDAAFSSLTDALHAAGILCIPEFWFSETADPRFVTDVLRYWLLTFRVDGFRLVGGGAWVGAVQKDALLSGVKLLVSDAAEDAAAVTVKGCARRIGVYNAAYQHVMRRFLKGDPGISQEETMWMLQRNGVSFAWLSYLADQDGFTLSDAVSYEEKHNEANGEDNRDGCADNFTWNCGEEGASRRASVRQLRERQLRNALLMLFTSQGTPLLYAGDEMLNTQHGNNNAWCQDNAVGWVTWRRTKAAAALREFVKSAVAFREQHPVLHRKEPLRMVDYRSCGLPDLSFHGRHAWIPQHPQLKCAVGMLYGGAYAERPDGTPDDTLYILYNMYWQEQTFALPDPPVGTHWYLKADTGRTPVFFADGKEPRAADTEKAVYVPARSIYILIAK